MAPAAAVAIVWLLSCLLLPSQHYNFDGVACAVAVELGDWKNLLHGNHLLYAALGRLAFLAAGLLGYHGRALPILVLLNGALAAATLALFARLLLRLGVPEKRALSAAAGLGFSYAFWFYSLEAQVYPLGLLLVLGTVDSALEEKPSPGKLGLRHALALTGHISHICLAPALLYRLWITRPPGERREAVGRYALAGLLTTLAAYMAAGLLVRPESWRSFRVWLLGTAAIGHGRVFDWHGSFEPHLWLEGLVRSVWAQGPGITSGPGAYFWPQLGATLALVGLALWRCERRLASFMGLWLAGYWAFFSTWEPDNPNYHLTDLAAVWTLLALAGTPPSWSRRHSLALAAAAAGLASHNLLVGIAPLTKPESNPMLSEMRFVAEATPEESWVATLEGGAMVYVPYFARRRPWTLARRAQEPGPHESVYALAEVIDDDRWRAALSENWDWQEIRQGSLRLYKLRRKAAGPEHPSGTLRPMPAGLEL